MSAREPPMPHPTVPCASAAPSASRLDGLTVLCTRPDGQVEALVGELRRRGAHALALPVLEIEFHDDAKARERIGRQLADRDIVLFVSRNAVDGLIRSQGSLWPEGRSVLGAVGQATRMRLEERGLEVGIVPDAAKGRAFGTEALLDEPGLAASNVAGKRVAIVRGQDGRELLARTLIERGAEVTYVPVYRRRPKAVAPARRAEILALTDPWVIVTSAAAAHALWSALGGERARTWLAERTYVTVSARVGRVLEGLGVERAAVVAEQSSDAALVAAVVRHWQALQGDFAP